LVCGEAVLVNSEAACLEYGGSITADCTVIPQR
jgi:hypothetical protein